MCLPAMDEFLSRIKRHVYKFLHRVRVQVCTKWNHCTAVFSPLEPVRESFVYNFAIDAAEKKFFLPTLLVSYCRCVCLSVMRFGHWVCGESWHAIKGSLTHRPSSQGWAPGVSSKSNAILSVIILKRGLIISMEWTN